MLFLRSVAWRGRALAPYPDGAAAMRRAPCLHARGPGGYTSVMYTLLWIIAAVLVIAGIVGIVRGEIVWGIALIVAGLLIGPGGVSLIA